MRIANEEGSGKLKSELEQVYEVQQRTHYASNAKHRSAAKESEETVKMLHEDISCLRSELESVSYAEEGADCCMTKKCQRQRGNFP